MHWTSWNLPEHSQTLKRYESIKPKIGSISSPKISGNSPKLSQPRSPFPKLDPFGKISVKLQHPISRMLSGRKCKSGSRHLFLSHFSHFSISIGKIEDGKCWIEVVLPVWLIIDSLDQTRSGGGMLETVCTPPLVRGMNENGG